MQDDSIWYYEFRGGRTGPVTAEALRQKMREGAISETTLCWQPSFGNQWRALRDAGFGGGPPPLPGTFPGLGKPAVSDGFAWAFVFYPVILAVIGGALSSAVALSAAASQGIGIGVTFGLAAADRQLLQKAGYAKPPSLGWAIISPVYLWKRGTLLGRGRPMFWIHLAVLVVVISAAILAGMVPDDAN